MGFALWIDREQRLAWVRGTHEYRPMGTAVIALTDRFRHRDFRQTRLAPAHLRSCFIGFFGSLETVNEHLHSGVSFKPRITPPHLL
jgi:hypothetical protein